MIRRNKFRALVATLLVGGITLTTPQSIFAVTSLQGDSIYEIMVDRFYDGDATNNASGDAFRYTENSQDDFRYMHGGDWQGIIDKIPYIKGMGYTAIWISPVGDPQLWGIPDANGKQWPTAYHGYNVNDPNRANRYFGTSDPQKSKEKLKELVDTCHENGIKVIFDVVPNHVGDYLQGIGSNAHYTSDNGNLKAGTQLQPAAPFNQINWYHNLGDIDFSKETPHNAWSNEMLQTHDLGGLDDINFDNPAAKQAMFDSVKNWFAYTGADAARVDAAKCMRPSTIHQLQDYLGVTTFGENFDMDANFIKDWVGSNGENGMLDFPLFQAVVNDFAYGNNFDNTSEISLKSVLAKDSLYGSNVNEMVTFIDNHDRNRFLTEAGGNVAKMQNALAFIFACRGVPVVFQGTEQDRGNANGAGINGIADTYNRWSMQTKDSSGHVIKDYFNTNTDTYKYIASLNQMRQDNVALQTGTQREMWSAPHMYAFSRRIDSGEKKGSEVICAFHNTQGSDTVTMPLRAESTIAPGSVLENVMDANDKIVVSADKKVTISLNGDTNKIYKLSDKTAPVGVSNVTFSIANATTSWGQNVYIVGNCPQLGNWDPKAAVGPATCPNYPTWQLQVSLPQGQSIEWKAIKKDSAGNVVWESGSNHTFTVSNQSESSCSVSWTN